MGLLYVLLCILVLLIIVAFLYHVFGKEEGAIVGEQRCIRMALDDSIYVCPSQARQGDRTAL